MSEAGERKRIGVDEIIWTMIEDAVPSLLPALRTLLETAGEDGA